MSGDDAGDVKAWRVKCKLTQATGSAAIGVSIRTLQAWEQGRPVPAWAWKLMAYVELYGRLTE